MALGLIDGKILYGDGTILKAWCNTFNKMYPYEIDYLKKFLESNVSNKEFMGQIKDILLKRRRKRGIKRRTSRFIK